MLFRILFPKLKDFFCFTTRFNKSAARLFVPCRRFFIQATMTRITTLSIIMLASAMLFLNACKEQNSAYPHKLYFVSEEYRPFNYTEAGKVTGLAPEILKEICLKNDIPFEVEMLPWSDAMERTRQQENTVLFSTILNETRKDEFKWAGPFASLDWQFYSASAQGTSSISMDQARGAGKIGVLQDYSITQYLQSENFNNFVYCDNNVDAFQKLLAGEIDLFPSDRITADAALTSIGHSIYDVAARLVIRTELVYFAFNKQTPDAVVNDFQAKIDAMKTDGSLDALYRQFMQSPRAPGLLQVYTEDYPPLTFRNSFGDITGFGSDIVYEIMKRSGQYQDIRLSLWSNGYNLALNNPSFCLFTMDRTPIRETLFNWVGPIGTNTTFFYTKTGSSVTINTIDDARALQHVGTVSSWFSDQYLREKGFTNLVAVDNPAEMVEKLMQGEVQAAVCSDVTIGDILVSTGYTYQQIQPSFSLMATDYYIAFSKGTPEDVILPWQQALNAMKTDGTYTAIKNKWFPM